MAEQTTTPKTPIHGRLRKGVRLAKMVKLLPKGPAVTLTDKQTFWCHPDCWDSERYVAEEYKPYLLPGQVAAAPVAKVAQVVAPTAKTTETPVLTTEGADGAETPITPPEVKAKVPEAPKTTGQPPRRPRNA